MIERYSSEAMRQIWSEEHKLKSWLIVELAVAQAQAALGIIPKSALHQIQRRARIRVKRAAEIEKKTQHDIIAFVSATAEAIGPAGRYLHYGLTSTDVVDTAQALRLREASDLIARQLQRLEKALRRQAKRHQFTLMVGRSHGIHAEPITFGLKMAVFLAEVRRQQQRFQQARKQIEIGMLSGAVGTYAHQGPEVERRICRRLRLTPEIPSTQIVARDRHAGYLSVLALIAGTLEKIAIEIRHLQRTEVREAEEYFAPGQKGSSAMPHKRNPILCERISGLARVMRGYALAALEDMALWHERDISHSSVERMILPDATSLLEYQLSLMSQVIEQLTVYPEMMRRNLELTGGLIHSQQVLLTLVRKGLSREQAYRKVQALAMRAWKQKEKFIHLVQQDPELQRILTPKDLQSCFDLKYHTKYIHTIYRCLGIK